MSRLGTTICSLLATAAITAGCEGGSPSDSTFDRSGIVGGIETEHEIWKGVIAVVALNGDQPAGICTGTMIHPGVVLTAGHCVRLKAQPLQPGYDHTADPSGVIVKYGAEVGMGGGGELLSEVAEARAHPTWAGTLDPGVAVDLALLKLTDPDDSLGTYCVREDDSLEEGDPGIIVGYGLTGSMAPASAGTHRWGETTIRKIEEQTIEIGDPTATCQGDSGGPLFTKVDDRWEVTGVTSYGGLICLPKRGAYSAAVLPFVDWIEDTLEEWTGDSLGECTERGHDPSEGDGGTDVDTDTGPEEDAGEDTDDVPEPDAGDEPDTGPDDAPDAGDAGEEGSASGGCDCRAAAPSLSILRLVSRL